MGSDVLIIINCIAIAVIGGTYYLLAERFAPEMPLAIDLIIALLAGLLMAVVNHLALNRRFGAREEKMTFQDWNHLILVFSVTAGAILSLSQLVLSKYVPEARTGNHLLMLALYLLILGLTAHSQGSRSSPEQTKESQK